MITWTHSLPTWEFRRHDILCTAFLIVCGLHHGCCIFIASVCIFSASVVALSFLALLLLLLLHYTRLWITSWCRHTFSQTDLLSLPCLT
jgi:hypothetical protein